MIYLLLKKLNANGLSCKCKLHTSKLFIFAMFQCFKGLSICLEILLDCCSWLERLLLLLLLHFFRWWRYNKNRPFVCFIYFPFQWPGILSIPLDVENSSGYKKKRYFCGNRYKIIYTNNLISILPIGEKIMSKRTKEPKWYLIHQNQMSEKRNNFILF